MNTLHLPLIRVRPVARGQGDAALTLPGTLAWLARDAVASFSVLRPHQRHAWHAFLVLLAANALHRAGLSEPPVDEATWRDLLRGLAPQEADDAPWCLITPPKRPALLQPPIPSGNLTELKNEITTPDELDMLVTAKNHDLKQTVMVMRQPDDWLFALVTLQTMEGFLGAGNYGISRMNGGFANRAALGIAPPGGLGAHWRRDTSRLLSLRGKIRTATGYVAEGGLALVWLAPWDGTTSLRSDGLDEWYIEICRRIRLTETSGVIAARAGSSKVARIFPAEGGVTGDPWSPVVTERDGRVKALTVDARGFGYRRMVDLMFQRTGILPSPLQGLDPSDPAEDLRLVARALVRGQGKTEGYHERWIPISRRIRRKFLEQDTDQAAGWAIERVKLAGEVQERVLKPALLMLFQNGPAQIDFRDKDSTRKAEPFLRRFDAIVDATFFEDLWREVDQDEADAQKRERGVWVNTLLDHAKALLRAAESAAARASRRRFRSSVRAADRLGSAAYHNEQIKPYLQKAAV